MIGEGEFEVKKSEAQKLHSEAFGEDDRKLREMAQQNNMPLNKLVADAQELINKGETYTILIKQGSAIEVNGVPFMAVKIKGKLLHLKPMPGYELAVDNPANRRRLNYIEDALEEKEELGLTVINEVGDITPEIVEAAEKASNNVAKKK